MPMSGAGLTSALKDPIATAIKGNFPVGADAFSQQQVDKFATALSAALGPAIVDYLKANMLVTVTGTVTSGPGSGGAVTGTGQAT